MGKARARARPDEEEEDGQQWERTRQALRPEQQRAPALPVLGGGGGGEDWVAQPQAALAAVPAVQGVTVVDDLAAELERQQQEREAQQRQQQQQEQQPPDRKQAQAGQRQRAATGVEALRGIQSREQRRAAAKAHLATTAQQLLQDPPKQLPQLKGLLELVQDEDSQVRRLAMLTLLAVFRDLIPAYRIRPSSEEEPPEKLSKEVRALRSFEAGLLDSYHAYLKALLKAFKGSNAGQAPLQQGRIAVKCMAGLLEAAPHFNYRSDLMQALVSCLSHKDEQIREVALQGLTALLASSAGDGEVATEAVQLLADLVRRSKCVMPPASLDCLLVLRFPDVIAPAAAADQDGKRKKKKQKRGRDEVDRSFLEAQAAADVESRRANQTATLDALFELLFRVLKTCSSSGLMQQQDAAPMSRRHFMKKFPLLFPALRLLSKFIHVISIEYIEDITAELRTLLRSSALPPQERLRVLQTAAEIVQGQNGAVSVEHTGFYSELYAALKRVALVPLLDGSWQGGGGGDGQGAVGAGEGQGAGQGQGSEDQEEDELLGSLLAAADQTDNRIGGQVCFLLPQVLESFLLNAKPLDAPRQAAFVKRMLSLATAAGDTGLAMGLLAVLQRLLRRSRRLQGMLQHEAGGPSTQGYQPDAEDPSEAAALSAPLWELSLLAQHYHPSTAGAARQLAAGGQLAAAQAPPPQVGAAFSTAAGAFNPPPGGRQQSK